MEALPGTIIVLAPTSFLATTALQAWSPLCDLCHLPSWIVELLLDSLSSRDWREREDLFISSLIKRSRTNEVHQGTYHGGEAMLSMLDIELDSEMISNLL